MVKFTKGNWENVKNALIYAPEGEYMLLGTKKKGVIIAWTHLFESINGSDPEKERGANARLIAAAPEMYQHLRLILNGEFSRDDVKRLLARIDGIDIGKEVNT